MITIHGPALLDLNTQRDLLSPDGIYPVYQAEKLVEPMKRLFQWVHRHRVPVVSTRLRELTAPGQRGMNRVVCRPETTGFQKVSATQLRKRQEMPRDCGTSLPVEGFRVMQQWIFDLPSLNLFECPRLDRLLSESEVGVWLIVGSPLEWTIRTAVLGLLQRRQKVAVVRDCIGQWDPYEGDMALRQIESKNIEWLTSGQLEERFTVKRAPRLVSPLPRVGTHGHNILPGGASLPPTSTNKVEAGRGVAKSGRNKPASGRFRMG